jgi:hypothetical protein
MSVNLVSFLLKAVRSDNWMLTALPVVVGLIVLSTGIDSVAVRKERSALVFAAMIVDLPVLLFVVGKALLT